MCVGGCSQIHITDICGVGEDFYSLYLFEMAEKTPVFIMRMAGGGGGWGGERNGKRRMMEMTVIALGKCA